MHESGTQASEAVSVHAADPLCCLLHCHRLSERDPIYISETSRRCSSPPMRRDRDCVMDAAKQPRRGATVDHAFIRFLLPVSALFLVLSYCHSCYVRLLSLEFTSTLLHDLDHFISRKAMLLFCNALLWFVTRDSGLLGFFAPTTNISDEESDHKQVRREHGDPTAKPCPAEEKAAVTGGAETKGCEVEETAEAEGDASLELVAVEGMDMERVDEGETEDEDIDELHRKIEEFIERVKSERRMEARQLVVV